MLNPVSMKKSLLIILSLFILLPILAQKELYLSQYMHSRYTINSAFGGSSEALSVFGAYRKQWLGLNGAPASQFFSAHTPLKNEQIALGVEFFGQQYAVSQSNGFATSYTYRIRPSAHTRLGIGLNVGLSFNSADWNQIAVKSTNDPSFESAESRMTPLLGLGAAWYGDLFFAGVSVPNFFSSNWVDYNDSRFSLGDAHYLITGGYLVKMAQSWWIQPSALVHLSKQYGLEADAGVNLIWNNLLWLGSSYRTTEEFVVMAGYQVMTPLRVIYSWDKGLGTMGGINSGSHEISLRYEFGVKIPATNPRFF